VPNRLPQIGQNRSMRERAGQLVFRTSAFVRFWSWAWFALALALILDVVRRGSIESSGRVAIAVLLFISSIVWVSGLRPTVLADDERITLRNPFRDVLVPWHAVTDIDATDMLRVHVGERSHGSWAIQVPNRLRHRAVKTPEGVLGERGQAPSPDVLSEVVGRTHADFVAAQLRERWAARRSAALAAPAGSAAVTSWSPMAIAAVGGTLVFLIGTIVAA
jgi:hypothetical protein